MRGLLDDIQQGHLDPRRLTFEVTESAIVTDFTLATQSLTALRKLGCKIAIDDFGTGFSSFSCVTLLRPDVIKLDREIVEPVDTNPMALGALRAAVDLAHHVGAQVVAEGVERVSQLCNLQRYGCDYVQGFLFSKPISLDELVVFAPDTYIFAEARRRVSVSSVSSIPLQSDALATITSGDRRRHGLR